MNQKSERLEVKELVGWQCINGLTVNIYVDLNPFLISISRTPDSNIIHSLKKHMRNPAHTGNWRE